MRELNESTGLDELAAVRDLLAVPKPSLEAVVAGRSRLLAAMSSPEAQVERRRRAPRRWLAVGVGLVGAAAAAAVAKTPAEGAYWRTRTVWGTTFSEPGRRYLIRRSTSHEQWLAQRPGAQSWWIDQYLGARPATPQDETAWREAGSPSSWQYPVNLADLHDVAIVNSGEKVESLPGEPVATRLRGGWKGTGGHLTKESMTWAELRAIPSGTQELRAYLEARITRLAKKYPVIDMEQEMERRLQSSCTEILEGLPVSPKVRASAYRILASLPGMRAEGEVTDLLGRTGQALSYHVDSPLGPQDGIDVRLVIDPKSGLPLAIGSKSVGRLKDGRSVDIENVTAYEEVGWTDEEPEIPAQHD
ncbi:hypothetical protein [Microtetraspora glauca]|uniref:CU044_5270 family protein n=1 Tax=Microtetraspora glauca TaxID=1996 RepID=A0ABV3GM50_MICGL